MIKITKETLKTFDQLTEDQKTEALILLERRKQDYLQDQREVFTKDNLEELEVLVHNHLEGCFIEVEETTKEEDWDGLQLRKLSILGTLQETEEELSSLWLGLPECVLDTFAGLSYEFNITIEKLRNRHETFIGFEVVPSVVYYDKPEWMDATYYEEKLLEVCEALTADRQERVADLLREAFDTYNAQAEDLQSEEFIEQELLYYIEENELLFSVAKEEHWFTSSGSVLATDEGEKEVIVITGYGH